MSLEDIRIDILGCTETSDWAAKEQGMTVTVEGKEVLGETEEVGKTEF